MKPDHRIVEPTQNEEPSMRLVRVMPHVVHVGQNGIAGESGYYGALEFTDRAVQYLNPATNVYSRLAATCCDKTQIARYLPRTP